MDTKKQYDQEQKFAVLESAAAIGIKEAAKLAGVHYTTIYEWRNQLTALGQDTFLAKQTISKGRDEANNILDALASIDDVSIAQRQEMVDWAEELSN